MSAGKAKAKASSDQRTLGSTGDEWRLDKQPATPGQRGTTTTLRKSHTAMMDRTPTVFPNALISTFDEAPSAEKRKILDEADKISKEEREKLAKKKRGNNNDEAGGSVNVDSPPLAHHGKKRTDSSKKRSRARSARSIASGSADFMQAPPSP